MTGCSARHSLGPAVITYTSGSFGRLLSPTAASNVLTCCYYSLDVMMRVAIIYGVFTVNPSLSCVTHLISH